MEFGQRAKGTDGPFHLSERERALPTAHSASANLITLRTPSDKPTLVSRPRKAVSQVFSSLAEGWSNKANLIESRGGVSDRGIRVLIDLLKPESRILDLGAGDGKLASAVLAAAPNVDLTLVDSAPGMAQALRDRFGSNPRVRVLQADLHSVQTKLAGEQFDLVALLQVLHHIPRPKLALAAAASLLAKTGRLVTLTVGAHHHEAIIPIAPRDGLGRRRASAWVAITEEAGLEVDVMYRDESWFSFQDESAYAEFIYRIGSLEKLNGYRRLCGRGLANALRDVADRSTVARCSQTGRIVARNEYVTIVARRGHVLAQEKDDVISYMEYRSRGQL